jgi:heme/copper-type cytochrome/quinol oxidase subunit 2
MRGNTARVVGGILVVVVAIVLLVVLKDNGSDNGGDNGNGAASSAAINSVPTIVVKHGKPVGGIRELTYVKGDRIRFQVDSDVSDEVHVHGYDLMKDVKAGGSVRFDFPASLEGVFEAELEGRKEQIIELRVNP